jgi:hypothetical protein
MSASSGRRRQQQVPRQRPDLIRTWQKAGGEPPSLPRLARYQVSPPVEMPQPARQSDRIAPLPTTLGSASEPPPP